MSGKECGNVEFFFISVWWVCIQIQWSSSNQCRTTQSNVTKYIDRAIRKFRLPFWTWQLDRFWRTEMSNCHEMLSEYFITSKRIYIDSIRNRRLYKISLCNEKEKFCAQQDNWYPIPTFVRHTFIAIHSEWWKRIIFGLDCSSIARPNNFRKCHCPLLHSVSHFSMIYNSRCAQHTISIRFFSSLQLFFAESVLT